MNRSFSPDDFALLLLKLSLLFLFVHVTGSEYPQTKGSTTLADICTLNCQKNISETELAVFCSQSSNLKLQDRCCVNVTSPGQFDIIGIDLQQCNLTKTKLSDGIDQINTLQYIYLQGNSLTELNNTDFHRNTDILNLLCLNRGEAQSFSWDLRLSLGLPSSDDITWGKVKVAIETGESPALWTVWPESSIPLNVLCPGGVYAWEKIEQDATVRTCLVERNPCIAENLTCPLNSHCVHSGIDLTECLCDDDYHGYKCMNKGKFPTIPFAIGTSVATVFTCIFLWCTQRRYVKSVTKK